MRTSIAALFLLSTSCATRQPATTRAHAPEVVVLGSLHDAMLDHLHYTLRELVSSFEQMQPEIVLTEVRPEHPGALEGSIDGGIEQSIVYAWADVHHVPVIPVDWFDDDFVRKSLAENDLPSPPLADALSDQYSAIVKTGTFVQIQSRTTEDIVRKMYESFESVGHTSSKDRNEHICANVSRALASFRGRRALIVFGLDHKYFLDACVGATGARALAVEEWWKPDAVRPIPEAIKQMSIANIEQAHALLQSRLEVDDGSALRPRLMKKEALRGVDSGARQPLMAATASSRVLTLALA